jgi:serine/threonine protein kinase
MLLIFDLYILNSEMNEIKSVKTVFSINESKYIKLSTLYNLNMINKVYLAKNIETDEMVVIKKLRSLGNRKLYRDSMKKELENMKQVSNKHVISVYHDSICGNSIKIKSKDAYFITMEYSKYGDFFNLLNKTEKGFPLNVALYYFVQLVEGIQAIHKSDLMHRDIKLENILLDENYDLKITDLEFSERLTDDDGNYIKSQRIVGSEAYMAPELFSNKEYFGDKADIYSCGITLYLFLNKRFPIKRANKSDSRFRLFMSNRDEYIRRNLNKETPDEIIKLLSNMFNPDPDSRITLSEIKESIVHTYDKENIIEYINTLIYKFN